MAHSFSKVEALLPRHAPSDRILPHEYREYAFTNEGEIPSSDLINPTLLRGTSEDHFKLIAARALHPASRSSVGVDRALRLAEQKSIVTYLAKPLHAETELQYGFQWVTFKFIPPDLQIAILSLRSLKNGI